MMYVRFTENNDWEGEEWSFYIPVEGNEDAIKFLDEKFCGDTYTITKERLTEKEVDTLERFGGEGYMKNHNKLVGILDYKKLEKVVDTDKELGGESDPLYKGGIKDFMRHVKVQV